MSNLSNCFEYKERFGRLDRDLNIIEDFYEPLLANSVKYDRACGYFSSSALSLASKGFSKFCENPNNRMRLIAGAKVHEQDRDAIVNSKEYYEDFVTNILRKELRDSLKEDDYKQFRLKGLAWMIQKELLDIKICLILDRKGRIMTHQQAEFHPKFGILRDEENNLLHFEGGINESRRAWHENWDSICVHASWKEGQRGFIQSSKDEFEALWNVEGRDPELGVAVVSLPEAAKNDWLEFHTPVSPSKIKEPTPHGITPFTGMDEVINRLKNAGLEEKIHPIKEVKEELEVQKEENIEDEKWSHQQLAVDLFMADKNDAIAAPKPAGRQGILCMATGTGKTRTAVKIINKMLKDKLIDQVIITTRSAKVILPQWEKDLDLYCNEMFMYNNYDNVHQSGDFKWSDKKPKALLCSIDSFEKFLINNQNYDLTRCLLIADECHNFRGEMHINKMENMYTRFQYRLGLSATPYTTYNDEANMFLDDNIGDVYFQFTIEEAIKKQILVPFDYIKIDYEPSEKDKEKILKINKSYSYWIKEGKKKPRDKPIAISRVYKESKEKLKPFKKMIMKDSTLLTRSVIFVLTEKYGEKVTKIISEYGGENKNNWHVYYGGDNSDIIERFRYNDLNCLVTCEMLNEGIDVPSLSTVFLFSSDGADEGLTTTQRIGRALRFDKMNPDKIAKVVDFVRKEPELESNEYKRSKWLEGLSKIRPIN